MCIAQMGYVRMMFKCICRQLVAHMICVVNSYHLLIEILRELTIASQDPKSVKVRGASNPSILNPKLYTLNPKNLNPKP